MDCKATISIHAPPRGATHPDSAVHQARPPISIHAPPRGATAHGQRGVFALFISIHAPPRGATAKVWRQSCCLIISIHAPPRGATIGQNAGKRRGTYFNSRPSARGDRLSARSANLAFHFNSRPSARGDSKVTALYNKSEVFQFTPLREGRPCRTRHPRLVSISIHAPPRGATLAGGKCPDLCANISIHAPPRGATIVDGFLLSVDPISIHAPPRGATTHTVAASRHKNFNSRPSARGDCNLHFHLPFFAFQFTPLREGRLARLRVLGAAANFNSRPSARGDRFV